MEECRCTECNKLLAKLEGIAEIICTRCKVFNAFKVPASLREETSGTAQQYKTFCECNGFKPYMDERP